MNKETLNKNYTKACDDYVRAFCEKHDLDYYEWMELGYFVEIGDYVIKFDDIVTDIELDVENGKIFDYEDYCMRVSSISNELTLPNYKSWLNGCPTYSEEQLEKLETLKENVFQAESIFKQELKNF